MLPVVMVYWIEEEKNDNNKNDPLNMARVMTSKRKRKYVWMKDADRTSSKNQNIGPQWNWVETQDSGSVPRTH